MERVSRRAAEAAGVQDSNKSSDAWTTGAAIVLLWPAAFFKRVTARRPPNWHGSKASSKHLSGSALRRIATCGSNDGASGHHCFFGRMVAFERLAFATLPRFARFMGLRFCTDLGGGADATRFSILSNALGSSSVPSSRAALMKSSCCFLLM